MSKQIAARGLVNMLFVLQGLVVSAATSHVWPDSPNPAPPYTNWATAAHAIREAVDAAAPGDDIVVTNGVYATGGRAVHGLMTNRVVVDKPVTVRSVNGPAVTLIQGYQVPEAWHGLGDGAIRCVYLTSGAVLSGFTLTNGATCGWTADYDLDQSGGGVWCASTNALVTNCTLMGNFASSDGGGAYSGTLHNCAFTNNAARYGGGASSSTLNNCTLTGNSASSGGGAYQGTLDRCILAGNLASGIGGGAYFSTLNNCTLTGNSTHYGGGAYYSTLNNCVLTGNSASWYGGGAYGSILHNCTLTGNVASEGGGVWRGTLNNCVLAGNSAAWSAGGAYMGRLNNCILTGNSAAYGGGAGWSTLYNTSIRLLTPQHQLVA